MPVFENPIHDANIKLLAFIKKEIVVHEEFQEECTCHDMDNAGVCWYRLSDTEQMRFRIDNILRQLTRETMDGYPHLIATKS